MQDFLMMYFVIFFNSASVRLHNATYPLLSFYFWEGYPSVRYYSRIPYISLNSVFFWDFNSRYARTILYYSFLRYIDGAYSLGIPHILIFFRRLSCSERWEGGMEGICRAFWKLGMWQTFVKICQRGSPKKNIFGKYILRGEVGREIISK